jgi:hypothetical protein
MQLLIIWVDLPPRNVCSKTDREMGMGGMISLSDREWKCHYQLVS